MIVLDDFGASGTDVDDDTVGHAPMDAAYDPSAHTYSVADVGVVVKVVSMGAEGCSAVANGDEADCDWDAIVAAAAAGDTVPPPLGFCVIRTVTSTEPAAMLVMVWHATGKPSVTANALRNVDWIVGVN